MYHFFSSLLGILNAMSPYILLGFLVAGLLQAFVPTATMSRHLGTSGMGSVLKAALLGIPLPLCSCGVLPAAVALRRQGATKGASISFLVATPQTGVDSIAATYSLLGLPFALLRPIAAFVSALLCGWLVDKADSIAADMTVGNDTPDATEPKRGFLQKILSALHYGYVDIVASIGKWLVVGLVVAALITVFVPDDIFVGLSRHPLLAMLAVVVVAIPMYICATGSIPIAMSLMMKGLSPGIAFVLLMAGPAANFASLLILGKTHGTKTTAIYVATVALTAICFGLAIDLLMPSAWFVLPDAVATAGVHSGLSAFDTLCSAVLVLLLILAPILTRGHHHHDTLMAENKMATETLSIAGMSCAHCKKRVEEAAKAVNGVTSANVNLSKATLTVTGNPDRQELINAITRAGYDVIE